MVRRKEDVVDCGRRINDENEHERPLARQLDLRKVYPRDNTPVLRMLLARNDMKRKCLWNFIDLHVITGY